MYDHQKVRNRGALAAGGAAPFQGGTATSAGFLGDQSSGRQMSQELVQVFRCAAKREGRSPKPEALLFPLDPMSPMSSMYPRRSSRTIGATCRRSKTRQDLTPSPDTRQRPVNRLCTPCRFDVFSNGPSSCRKLRVHGLPILGKRDLDVLRAAEHQAHAISGVQQE